MQTAKYKYRVGSANPSAQGSRGMGFWGEGGLLDEMIWPPKV